MQARSTSAAALALVVATLAALGCGDSSYQREIEAFRAQRLARLTSENGWLTLCGLFWLKEGENTFGIDSACDIVLPATVPAGTRGSLWLRSGRVRLKASPGARILLRGAPVQDTLLSPEGEGSSPTVLGMGSVRFYTIERGGRIGVRVKDSQNPARLNFAGLDYFPIDEKWRIRAVFRPYTPARTIPISTVINTQEQDSCPGECVFSFGGKEYSLDAVAEAGSDGLLVMFSDETSGNETYPSGRQLDAPRPDSTGGVILDFNKALNWPCAFTDFATCPIPPSQNHLRLRVEAGEKKYSAHNHAANAR